MLIYTSINGVTETFLPWGEHIYTLDVGISAFGYLYFLSFLVGLGYIFVLTLRYVFKEKKDFLFLGIQSFLFLGAFNDILVDVLGLRWMYLGEFGFTLTVVFMGMQLNRDMIDGLRMKNYLEKREKQLSQLVQSSGAALFAVDDLGFITLYNRLFLDLCGISEIREMSKSCFSNTGGFWDDLVPHLKQALSSHNYQPVTFETAL